MEIPKGYCQCGCGGKTRVATYTYEKYGCVKGQPRRFMLGHNNRGKLRGSNSACWKGGTHINNGYKFVTSKNHPKAHNGYIKEATYLAEKALGKILPDQAVVHHYTPEQLVICQDRAYHNLLHRRQKALAECGHASWRKCQFCKQYDSPDKLYIPKKKGSVHHRSCQNDYRRRRMNIE